MQEVPDFCTVGKRNTEGARTEITHQNLEPSRHAYNDPDLSPIEFLTAVYNDASLPMSIRIDAARGLLPYTEPRPARVPSWNGCTIVIPPFEAGTADHEACTPPPPDPTRNHSQNPLSPSKTLTRADEAVAPQNLETTPDPQSLPDYSTLSTEEILHLKAIALKWGLPEPHLCSYCGHWLTVTYPDCICGSRDPSKMN